MAKLWVFVRGGEAIKLLNCLRFWYSAEHLVWRAWGNAIKIYISAEKKKIFVLRNRPGFVRFCQMHKKKGEGGRLGKLSDDWSVTYRARRSSKQGLLRHLVEFHQPLSTREGSRRNKNEAATPAFQNVHIRALIARKINREKETLSRLRCCWGCLQTQDWYLLGEGPARVAHAGERDGRRK